MAAGPPLQAMANSSKWPGDRGNVGSGIFTSANLSCGNSSFAALPLSPGENNVPLSPINRLPVPFLPFTSLSNSAGGFSPPSYQIILHGARSPRLPNS